LGLPRPIIKSHPEEKCKWPWARGAPENFRFPYNVSATTRDSDFNFGEQLGFTEGHHKIARRRKVWLGYGFPFNNSATVALFSWR